MQVSARGGFWAVMVPLVLVVGSVAPVVANPNELSEVEFAKPWLTCLVEKARPLATAPDSAPVIASAAVALCQAMEGSVQAALEQHTVERLMRDGVAHNRAEAAQVVASVSAENWAAYKAKMTGQLAAVVVQMRAAAVK